MTVFATPATEIARDRWGRPLIVPVGGGKPVPYTRATTVAGALDDLNGLMGWKQRMTALGLVIRPDLMVAVAAHRNDKEKLSKIVIEATEAAAASAAATTGTALHSLTEQVDRGETLGPVPESAQADLDAYMKATAPLTAVHIEQMAVLDDLKVAGTPDRVVEYGGEIFIADLKTGSISFPHKIAVQLALYAHGQPYDYTTGTRGTWGHVNTERAIIIHLPAGSGHCELVWTDIKAGWRAVALAVEVRKWRQQQGLTWPLDQNPFSLTELIATAPDVVTLTEIWAAHQADWTPEHTAIAVARKAQLLRKPISA